MWSLLFRLSIPFIALTMLAACVGLGSVVAHLLASRDRKRKVSQTLNDDEISSLIESDDEHTPILISSDTDEVAVQYPTLALLTSLSITVIKFFYFGTALASHEYLFSTRQTYTGQRYIQSKPWIHVDSSWSLLKASIPSILIFDFCIPVLFVVICVRYRDRLTSGSTRVYFGSLFDVYSTHCYWWEIVSTLRKLSVALILKAFPPYDALQSVLVVTVLSGTQLMQLSLNPWRRKSENFADSATSPLLIAALIFTRPSHFTHAYGTVWYIFALCVAFLIASLLMIGWHTLFGVTEYDTRLRYLVASYAPEGSDLVPIVDAEAEFADELHDST